MQKIVEVTSISKSYKNFQLNNISFSIDDGKIVGLIGQN